MGYKNKKISPKKRNYFWLGVTVLVVAVGTVIVYRQLRTDNQSTPNQAQSSSGELATQEDLSEQIPTEITPDKSLYVENEQYKIRYDEPSDTYTITLYAIINNPSQYESYKTDLKEYKQNALRYLSEHGVNIERVNIVYEPEEAKDL